MTQFVDLQGQQFGRLTVLSRDSGEWLCVCACGTKKVIAAQSLKRGATRSCGCLNKETTTRRNLESNPANRDPVNDLAGQRFGRLVADRYEHRSAALRSVWHCICDCGGTIAVTAQNLKRSIVRSCGCLRRTVPTIKNKRPSMRFAPPVPLHPRAHDLAGQRFGLLVAIHFVGRAKWYCSCDCGGTTVSTAGNLRRGVSTSCGCRLRATLVTRNKAVRARPKYSRPMVMRAGLRIDNTLWSLICQAWGERCAYCERLTSALTRDHVHPISKGGLHELGNLAPACRSCNMRKLNHDLHVALQKLGAVNFHARRIAAIVKLQEMLHA